MARREAQYGIVPIENSTEGSVTHAVDALVEGDLLIRAELELEVSQCLLTRAAGLTSIERVYSHPQPLGQCRVWLAKNLAAAQLVQSVLDGRRGARGRRRPAGAAIASRLASELYGLPVLRERIQDRAENVTRFVVVAHEDAPRTGDDKTTLAFSVPEATGAARCCARSRSSTKRGSTSRASSPAPAARSRGTTSFSPTSSGHRDDANVARAMTRLRERCPMVKHLGSYPRFARR